MNIKTFFEEEFKNTEKKRIRAKEQEDTLKKNYAQTFIKSVEKAANKKFCNDKIKKIKFEYDLNILSKINIYDHDNNIIHDKKIEDQIKKFYDMKKKANDKNSDRYFTEKKHKPNMHDNLLNRSLGEESYFNY